MENCRFYKFREKSYWCKKRCLNNSKCFTEEELGIEVALSVGSKGDNGSAMIMNQKIERIMVKTPQGDKYHGDIILSVAGVKMFVRTLDNKDKMKIFDAWSIHPDALSEIMAKGVECLEYRTPSGVLSLKLEDLDKMLSGELKSKGDTKLAFEKSFSGGKTIYIKEEAFNKI